MSNVSDVWRRDHPWAVVYDYFSARERLRRPMGRLIFGLDTRELFADLSELERVPVGGHVLDVPCGGGIALAALEPRRKLRWTAVDISPAMLRRTEQEARRRGLSQVRTVEASVEQLPLDDAACDLCFSFAGLHCFPDPARAVAEIARCLRPGGRFAGTVFLMDAGVRYAPLRLGGRAMGVLGPSGGAADLERWLREAGFTDCSVRRLGTLARFSATRGS
ncbi:MAG: class I SAM-dependent methyltransferase [Solirubrobacteraceae bacterium]